MNKTDYLLRSKLLFNPTSSNEFILSIFHKFVLEHNFPKNLTNQMNFPF